MIFFQINGHAEWGWGGCSVLPPFPPPRECAVEGNSQPFPGEEALLLPRIFIRHGKVGPAPRSGGSRSFLSLTGTRFGCSLPTCAAAEAKRTSPGPMSPSSTRSSGSGAAPGREGVPGAAWEQGERRPRGRRGIPVGYRQPICPRVHPRSPRPVPAPFLHPPAPGEDTGGVAPRCPGRGGPAVAGRSGGRTGPPHPGSAARREAALPGFSARSRGEPEPHAASPALPSAPPGSRCRPRHALLPAADPDGAPALRHAVRRYGPARLQPHLPAAGGADLSRERSRCRSRSAAGVRGRRFAAGVGRAGRALPRAQRELPPPLPPPRLLQHRAVPGAARARAVREGGGAPRWGGGSSRDWKVWGAPGCSGPPGVQRKLGGVSLPPSPPVILSAPWGW